jgi:chromosome segregation ATPase
MTFRNMTLVGLLLIGVGGCAISEMHHDIEKSQRNIADLNRKLSEEQAQQDGLESKKRKLIEELKSKQLSLEELQIQLNALQEQNQAAKATTAEALHRQRELDDQLKRYQDEIGSLQQSKTSSMKEKEDKEKKIMFLRKKIREQLELGLH